MAALNGSEPFITGLSEYVINNKKNDRLKVFEGEPAKWKYWKNRIIDHFCGSSTKWRTITESVELASSPFTKTEIMKHPGGNGEDALRVVEKSHTLLGNYISETLYGRRVQMEGGTAKTGNGFLILAAVVP